MADKKKARTMSDALFGGKGSYKGGPSYKRAMDRRKRKEEIAQAKKEMADFYKNKNNPAQKDVKKPSAKKPKDSAAIRLMKLKAEREAAKTAPTSGLKGVKLDRERGDKFRSLNTQSLTASERAAAGRTKQSRRDLRDPTVFGRIGVRSFPSHEETRKHRENIRKWGGRSKLLGGINIPAIAKARPAFTEVERPPKTRLKKGGRLRMDGTAKPR